MSPSLKTRRIALPASGLALALLLASCLGGGSSSNSGSGGGSGASSSSTSAVGGPTASATPQPVVPYLTVTDVRTIIAQAAQEATLRGKPATIAVTDRSGNVLAAFRMNNANNADSALAGNRNVTVLSNAPNDTGLNGVNFVPDTLAAISKAVTGAYLSSAGNAFTTRSASQIVQNHFNPGELNTGSGPLYGVQFSQLPCSDVNIRFVNGGPVTYTVGPKRSPLGLSADPGGLPLYKNGVLVGGVGAIADGVYGLDAKFDDIDTDVDELIAQAGATTFEPPSSIKANMITVGGKLIRYTDLDDNNLLGNTQTAPGFDTINGTSGSLVAVTGYYTGAAPLQGQEFNQVASGVRPETTSMYGDAYPAYVLVDANNVQRFPARAGTVLSNDLTVTEVRTIIRKALEVAYTARGQIRIPLGSSAQVSITVVDTAGAILGLARTTDAPLFGTDVAVQKARSVMFMSSTNAATLLTSIDALQSSGAKLTPYITAARSFITPTAFGNGTAYSARALGNIARPLYPDGIDGSQNGPLARALPFSTPFSTGLQLDLVFGNIAGHILYTRGAQATDTPVGCTNLPVTTSGVPVLANGLQIFPGGVPIYRGSTLVGAIGVSGDGIDQDDMVSFLGLYRAGIELNTGIANAPSGIRADTLTPQGTRLRYVNCPFSPFIGSSSTNVCDGI